MNKTNYRIIKGNAAVGPLSPRYIIQFFQPSVNDENQGKWFIYGVSQSLEEAEETLDKLNKGEPSEGYKMVVAARNEACKTDNEIEKKIEEIYKKHNITPGFLEFGFFNPILAKATNEIIEMLKEEINSLTTKNWVYIERNRYMRDNETLKDDNYNLKKEKADLLTFIDFYKHENINLKEEISDLYKTSYAKGMSK